MGRLALQRGKRTQALLPMCPRIFVLEKFARV